MEFSCSEAASPQCVLPTRNLFQELTQRAPGRLDADGTTFIFTADLAAALRRAEAAHGEHEKRTGGQRDENWPDWYSEYMASEQAGKDLPL